VFSKPCSRPLLLPPFGVLRVLVADPIFTYFCSCFFDHPLLTGYFCRISSLPKMVFFFLSIRDREPFSLTFSPCAQPFLPVIPPSQRELSCFPSPFHKKETPSDTCTSKMFLFGQKDWSPEHPVLSLCFRYPSRLTHQPKPGNCVYLQQYGPQPGQLLIFLWCWVERWFWLPPLVEVVHLSTLFKSCFVEVSGVFFIRCFSPEPLYVYPHL